MRRSDRELKDPGSIREFLDKEKIMRVGFADEGEVFIVPVNYGYLCEDEKYTFIFHGAKAGRKYQLAKGKPMVGFEIDGRYETMKADAACDFSAHFQSVIGTGRLTLVEEDTEKEKLLCRLMKQVTDSSEWSFDNKMLKATAVFKLDVEKLTCKVK